MLSRESRVFLVSTVLFLLLVFAAGLTGFGDGNAVLVIVLFGGVGIFAPQLYLVRTGSDVPARTRIRAATFLTVLFTFGIYGTAPTAQRPAVASVAALLLLAFLGYEFLGGYRESTADRQQEP